MLINIYRDSAPADGEAAARSLNEPLGRQYGAWGIVDARHSEDVTVDVLLETGGYLHHVPVASSEWVIVGKNVDKEYNSGERDLPPLRARVFVFMLNYDDCFVAPFSGFSMRHKNEPFYAEGQETIRERITPSGWHITHDNDTGSHLAVSPDKNTSVQIDYGTADEPKNEVHVKLFGKGDQHNEHEVQIDHVQGDSCTVTVYDTVLVIKKGEVTLTTPKITVTADEAKITGGTLQVGGTVAPSSGPFCAIPNCLFAGTPHGGDVVSGT